MGDGCVCQYSTNCPENQGTHLCALAPVTVENSREPVVTFDRGPSYVRLLNAVVSYDLTASHLGDALPYAVHCLSQGTVYAIHLGWFRSQNASLGVPSCDGRLRPLANVQRARPVERRVGFGRPRLDFTQLNEC